MKRPALKKYGKNIICIACVLVMCILNSKIAYAMESLNELIGEKLISTNAKEYEMNIVLEDIGIKPWQRAPYSMDEIEANSPVDEPLGKYSAEKIKEYTDENFRAEFEYCYGYYGSARESHLIQVVRIYKDDKLYALTYEIWTNYKVNPVIEYGGSHFMSPEDLQERMKQNKENYK